jgi:hypothetical protein
VPVLLRLGAELERDHALDRDSGDLLLALDDELVAEANSAESASADNLYEFDFKALESQANFDRVLYEGTEFGFSAEPGSLEEEDFIGIPGLLEPEQVREVLRARQARQSRRGEERRRQRVAAGEEPPPPLYRTLKEQRTLLNSLVGMRSKISGEPHALIHAELRRICGGPAVAQASVTQLQARIDLLRKRAGSGR